ncbi:MAG: flavodoxin family protein [Clostridiaceae bacterium]
MKLLLINSSGRTGGNTARVMDELEENLVAIARSKGLTLTCERVSLARLSLKPCVGCRVCFDRGEAFCPQQDELLTLYERMRAADGYVIASPVYVEDVNGILKTMIDRMAFLCHRPALYGKSALLFTTSGIGSSRHALTTMTKAFGTWGIKTAATMQLSLGALMPREQVSAQCGKKVASAARRFIDVLAQTPFRPSFYSLIAFTVQQTLWGRPRVDHASLDYRYWQETGWLDRKRWYYDPAQKHSLKALLARMLGKLIALFFH